MEYTEDQKLQIYLDATDPEPQAVHEYYRSLSLLQKIHGYRDADELYERYAKEIDRLEKMAADNADPNNSEVQAYRLQQQKKRNMVTIGLIALFCLSLLIFVLVLCLTTKGYIVWPCLTICLMIGVVLFTQVIRPAMQKRAEKKAEEKEKQKNLSEK
jgi:Flp pilus assembly protein TadB